MREVFADFAKLSARPELGLGLCIPLGREDAHPELAGLKDGEAALLVEWGELQAPGIAKLIEQDGVRYWYGLVRREDIQPVAATETSGSLPCDMEAAFEQEFDPESPGMRYLRDR